jgi:hypothetical protein
MLDIPCYLQILKYHMVNAMVHIVAEYLQSDHFFPCKQRLNSRTKQLVQCSKESRSAAPFQRIFPFATDYCMPCFKRLFGTDIITESALTNKRKRHGVKPSEIAPFLPQCVKIKRVHYYPKQSAYWAITEAKRMKTS